MSQARRPLEEQLSLLAALEEPVRRLLFLFVSRHGPGVSREQAARGVKISRPLAAFHLDRLVDAGLLEASFRRLSGRDGPGAGRPSKLYARAPRQVEISVPERRYELAGRLMAAALAGGGSDAARALDRAAREHGKEMGAAARSRAGEKAGPERLVKALVEVLRASGFEPARSPEGALILRNCPFEALQREHRGLICGMNLALLQGLADEIRIPGLTVRLLPAEGRCCVVLNLNVRTRPQVAPAAADFSRSPRGGVPSKGAFTAAMKSAPNEQR